MPLADLIKGALGGGPPPGMQGPPGMNGAGPPMGMPPIAMPPMAGAGPQGMTLPDMSALAMPEEEEEEGTEEDRMLRQLIDSVAVIMLEDFKSEEASRRMLQLGTEKNLTPQPSAPEPPPGGPGPGGPGGPGGSSNPLIAALTGGGSGGGNKYAPPPPIPGAPGMGPVSPGMGGPMAGGMPLPI
jgi:hypothetical protein